METDEDMLVVIIGEDEQRNIVKDLSLVKNEDCLDLWDNKLAVEEIIESVQKYGQVINAVPKDQKIKVKFKNDLECEHLEEYKESKIDGTNRIKKKDKKIKLELNEDFECENLEEESKIEGRNKQCTIEELRRRRMLGPSERKSFVAELRSKYPELNDNKDALLKKIVEAMTNIKKPRLPRNYWRPKDDKFICQKCKRLFISYYAAKRHFEDRHGPRYLICFACGVDFRTTTSLYKHEKTCLAPDSVLVLKARSMYMEKRAIERSLLPHARPRKPVQKEYDLDLDDD